jgi:hypothetical protein
VLVGFTEACLARIPESKFIETDELPLSLLRGSSFTTGLAAFCQIGVTTERKGSKTCLQQ